MAYTVARTREVPFSIHIDKNKRLVVSTFTGRFTPEVILEARQALGSEPDFDPSFAHILDLCRVTAVDVPNEAVERLSRDRSMFHKTSVQVVVAPEKVKFDFANLFKHKSSKERPEMEVTRSLEAAHALIALTKAAKSG